MAPFSTSVSASNTGIKEFLSPPVDNTRDEKNPLKSVEALRKRRIWKSLLETNPLEKYLRRDYYVIFRFGQDIKILYEENINLDLGGEPVNFENIKRYIAADDLLHMLHVDQALIQLTDERRLQPWDYICRMYGNINCPNPALKKILRTSMLIHRDHHAKASIGCMCFQDVTHQGFSFNSGSNDISFDQDLSFLSWEIGKKQPCISIATVNPHRRNVLRKGEDCHIPALFQCTAKQICF